jgi:protein gp37
MMGWSCSRVSPGCLHCYAATINRRLGTGLDYTMANVAKIDFVLVEKEFEQWRKLSSPSRIFVCDMLDLFHEAMPKEYVGEVFRHMMLNKHTFQVLTKRPGIMARYINEHYPDWMPESNHIWLGTSVEDNARKPRIDVLRTVKAGIKFLSIEPLLEDVTPLDLTDISWVIVGGESGPGYRPMEHEWAAKIRDECRRQDVAFFFKQSAGQHTEMGTQLIDSMHPDGQVYEEFP